MKSLILWFSRFWNLLFFVFLDFEIFYFAILKSPFSRLFLFWNLLFLDFEIFYFSILKSSFSRFSRFWNLLFFDHEIFYFSILKSPISRFFRFWNISIFGISRFWNHQLFYFWIWFLILNYHLFVVNTVFENYSKCRIWIFQFLTFSTIFGTIKTDLSGNTVWPQTTSSTSYQILAKTDHIWHFWINFCLLKMET